MECLKRPVWNKYVKEELGQISLDAPDENIRKKVLANWDSIAKPLDGLGCFETLTARIGAATRSEQIDISRKAVLIMCADNGIVEEGVTQSGQEVTHLVAQSMAKKQSPVCRMAQTAGADTIPVDIGMTSKKEIAGVLNRKIRCGTRNFRREPAMTEEETVRAIAAGMELAASCKEKGIGIIATGEMGIGNTTTSSAVTAALLKCDVSRVTGRGAGLGDEGFLKKKQVIAEALEKYDLLHADAFTVLRTVGGLDIAGLAGVCVGGAYYHVPVVLDGVISLAAALVAERIFPGTREYLLPSHSGKEPAMQMLAEALDLEPVIYGGLSLGEGTGAVMMLSLLDLALSVYHGGGTFSEIQVEQYGRFESG